MKRCLGALLGLALVVPVFAADNRKPHVPTPHVPRTGLPGTGASHVRAVAVHQEVELQADDDIKVRLKNAPVQFDDKGKPKQLTADELKELKGPDPSLPGYQADFSDLKTGQLVRVSLARKKTSDDADKEKDKDADAKKEADKTDKSAWTPLGELTGYVSRLGASGSKDDKESKNPDKKAKAQGGLNKFTVRVDSVALTTTAQQRAQHLAGVKPNNTPQTLDDNVYVTMVVILSDGQASK